MMKRRGLIFQQPATGEWTNHFFENTHIHSFIHSVIILSFSPWATGLTITESCFGALILFSERVGFTRICLVAVHLTSNNLYITKITFTIKDIYARIPSPVFPMYPSQKKKENLKQFS